MVVMEGRCKGNHSARKEKINHYPSFAKDHLDDLQPFWESVDRTMSHAQHCVWSKTDTCSQIST